MRNKKSQLLMLALASLVAGIFSNVANAMMIPRNNNFHGHPGYQSSHYFQAPYHHGGRRYSPFRRGRVIIVQPGFHAPGIIVRRW